MPDVYQLIAEYQDGGGQYCANVWHFDVNTVAGDHEWPEANQLISAFDTANTAAIAACLSTDAKLTSYRCRRVSSGGGPEAIQIIGAVGTGATTMGAGSIGGQIRWIPFTAGHKTGRTTMPSPPSTWIIKDAVVSAYTTALQSLISSLLTAVTLANGDLAALTIWRRKTHDSSTVQFGQLNTKIGVQRRRLLRQQ